MQIYYYRWVNTGTLSRPEMCPDGDIEEATPLLTSSNDGQKSEKERSLKRHVLEYVGMVLCLIVAGIVAWAINEKVQGVNDGESLPEEILEWKSQLMGYTSAMLYSKHLITR
jgi:solute carrier family 66 (lysosomal lysine-arginine transporter), member 1